EVAVAAFEAPPDQRLDIGLVIDHQDSRRRAHAGSAARRGTVIVNSVYSPSCESTLISPRCSPTTISWLSESPSPVPSPAALVVKNGSKTRSRMSLGMP